MKCRGIDLSAWQGDFDLRQAQKEEFSFVIAKAGGADGGLYADSRFAQTYRRAKQLGMPIGAYWFSRACSTADAVREADRFAQLLRGRQLELPVYMDVEHRGMAELSRQELTNVVRAFCGRMEQHGYWAGIYSSLSWFRDRMIDDSLKDYAHWVAQWATECSYPAGPSLGMWQYGGEYNPIGSNQVAGQVVDQNYMLLDYPSMIPKAGRNGFPGFEDVSPDAWYAQAVFWARYAGVAAGTDHDHFSPDQICLRSQAVTMLWRTAGSPGSDGPLFSDVPPDAWYARAVRWAAEQGIAAGIGGNRFGPELFCTRAAFVTMLWRLAGSPEAGGGTWTDVETGDWFCAAADWAENAGISAGTGGGAFGPGDPCTRAAAVTMLWRFAGECPLPNGDECG